MFNTWIKSILTMLMIVSTFAMSAVVEVELQNNTLNPRPLGVVEENGEGNITFEFVETLNYEDIPHTVNGAVNTEIEITLTKIKVKGDDTFSIFFNQTKWSWV